MWHYTWNLTPKKWIVNYRGILFQDVGSRKEGEWGRIQNSSLIKIWQMSNVHVALLGRVKVTVSVCFSSSQNPQQNFTSWITVHNCIFFLLYYRQTDTIFTVNLNIVSMKCPWFQFFEYRVQPGFIDLSITDISLGQSIKSSGNEGHG